MKIFPKSTTRGLYNYSSAEEFWRIVVSWSRQCIYSGSPFLRQVCSYYLGRLGYSHAPRCIKQFVAEYLEKSTGIEDIRSTALLACVEAVREYDPSKGSCDLVNWMSWRVPKITSDTLKCMIKSRGIICPTPPLQRDIELFERTPFFDRHIDILSTELGISSELSYYYKSKARMNEAKE